MDDSGVVVVDSTSAVCRDDLILSLQSCGTANTSLEGRLAVVDVGLPVSRHVIRPTTDRRHTIGNDFVEISVLIRTF